MNYETVTLQDCIDNSKMKNKYAVIENGQVVGFENEEN